MSKLYFIVNVAARNGKSVLVWNKLLQILENNHDFYEVYFTNYQGHATELATMIIAEKEDIAAIIAVGGDGTIHEIVNGIVGQNKKVKVGYICAGSGNDFARGYDIPKSPAAALAFIIKNAEYSCPFYDVGEYIVDGGKSQFFVNSLGIGFDAEISKVANESSFKKFFNVIHLGFLTYVFILLKVWVSYERKTVNLFIDGEKFIFDKVWFITISNQQYYGGGMKISPKAIPYDGLLNITVVHSLSRFKLLAVFLSVFWGKHERFKEVKTMTGTSIEVNSADEMLIHADGELVGCTPVKVIVNKQQISYISRLIAKDDGVVNG